MTTTLCPDIDIDGNCVVSLPSTGASTGLFVVIGLGCVAAGVVIVVSARNRRRLG